MVQNMKRDSGFNICYINGNITVLIFNISFPFYVPTKHSYSNYISSFNNHVFF